MPMVCVTFVYSLRLTKLEQVPERSPFFFSSRSHTTGGGANVDRVDDDECRRDLFEVWRADLVSSSDRPEKRT